LGGALFGTASGNGSGLTPKQEITMNINSTTRRIVFGTSLAAALCFGAAGSAGAKSTESAPTTELGRPADQDLAVEGGRPADQELAVEGGRPADQDLAIEADCSSDHEQPATDGRPADQDLAIEAGRPADQDLAIEAGRPADQELAVEAGRPADQELAVEAGRPADQDLAVEGGRPADQDLAVEAGRPADQDLAVEVEEGVVNPADTVEDSSWVPGAGEAGADDGAIVIDVVEDDSASAGEGAGELVPVGDPAHPELR
jgi:hypothetical protein